MHRPIPLSDEEAFEVCAAIEAVCKSGGGSPLYSLRSKIAAHYDIDTLSDAFNDRALSLQRTARDEYEQGSRP